MLRWALSKILNRYPNVVFYGPLALGKFSFAALDTDQDHEKLKGGRAALLGVAVAVGRELEVGDILDGEFTTVFERDEVIGSFRITIERTE